METARKCSSWSHGKIVPVIVPGCEAKFTAENVFKQHVNAVHEATIKMLQCTGCEAKFTAENVFQQHINAVHEATIKMLQCTGCEAKFKAKHALKQHFKAVHNAMKFGMSRIGSRFNQKIQ